MNKCQMICIGFVLVLLFVTTAQAQEIPGWRGQSQTSYQMWGFETADNPVTANPINNPFGTAQAVITQGTFASGWIDDPGLGTRTGMWDIGTTGGVIDLTIDNCSDSYAVREIWVQVVYFQSLSQPPLIELEGGQLVDQQISLVESIDLGSWMLSFTKWSIASDGAEDLIHIASDTSFGSVIDEIHVDTRCIPEPGILLLFSAGIGLIRKMR